MISFQRGVSLGCKPIRTDRNKEHTMTTNNTTKLEKFIGREVKVNYNVAKDVHKPSVLVTGTLYANNYYYDVRVNGGTWIVFTDENVLNIWDESTLYIEIG
jgi:hypothetical protein